MARRDYNGEFTMAKLQTKLDMADLASGTCLSQKLTGLISQRCS